MITFTPNTPAKAEDVNNNFTYLQNQVQNTVSNASVYINDTKVGRLLTMFDIRSLAMLTPTNYRLYIGYKTIHTPSSYLSFRSIGYPVFKERFLTTLWVLFDNPNCDISGSYVIRSYYPIDNNLSANGQHISIKFGKGAIIRFAEVGDDNQTVNLSDNFYYYTFSNYETYQNNEKTFYQVADGTCELFDYNSSVLSVYPVKPFDSTVLGISEDLKNQMLQNDVNVSVY
ncbi:hypothetical protein [Nautilia sp.]